MDRWTEKNNIIFRQILKKMLSVFITVIAVRRLFFFCHVVFHSLAVKNVAWWFSAHCNKSVICITTEKQILNSNEIYSTPVAICVCVFPPIRFCLKRFPIHRVFTAEIVEPHQLMLKHISHNVITREIYWNDD